MYFLSANKSEFCNNNTEVNLYCLAFSSKGLHYCMTDGPFLSRDDHSSDSQGPLAAQTCSSFPYYKLLKDRNTSLLYLHL